MLEECIACKIMKSVHVRMKEMGLPDKPLEEVSILNSEANILSFIVRVWMEEPTSKVRQPVWRKTLRLFQTEGAIISKISMKFHFILSAHLKVQK